MQPTRKQVIYTEIMGDVLSYLRNLQTHSFLRRIQYGNFFAELELVHNLGERVMTPEFTNADAYWVGAQGRSYIKHGRRDMPFYDPVCRLIRELDVMVSSDMRTKLNIPSLEQ